jgi:NAD(P)-dependent dehydrogenase (short-subunit alcohol dehydrogenase family)
VSNSPSAAHQEQGMPPTAPAVDPWLRRREMPGLLGKNVLVTGGTSGIGQATAVRFAEHGANVAINYLTTPEEAAGTEEQVHTCLRKVRQHGVRDVSSRATSPPKRTSCAWSARRPSASAASTS